MDAGSSTQRTGLRRGVRGHRPRQLGPGNAIVTTKDQQRADALLDTQPIVLFVTAYSLVLLAVAFAVSVILVGARAREQSREIGLLRAIGLTPPQVGRVFAIESGVLGLLGVGIGFPVGALLAPVLAGSFADTMVASPTTSADPWHAGVAAVPVVLVLVLGTWLATRRQSRRPVINALNAGSAAQGRRSRIARRAARFAISPSLDLGLRNLLAVPSRATMLGLSLVVTGAAVVFALSVKASLDAARGSGPSDVPDGLPLLVYSLDVVLVLIAALGLIAVTLLAVREQMREFGILKTLGFTPGQITLSLTGSNTLLALVAGVILTSSRHGALHHRVRRGRQAERGACLRATDLAGDGRARTRGSDPRHDRPPPCDSRPAPPLRTPCSAASDRRRGHDDREAEAR